MVGYSFVLLAISLVLLLSGKGGIKNKIGYWCLLLMTACYIGLISLSANVEHTVASSDANPRQVITGWFGHDWLYVALFDIVIIIVLHVILAISQTRSLKS